jgi:hypothetical protein
MNLENQRMLELAHEHLGDLRDEVVFVGGATVELWITDPAAPEFRPTDDIDVIVEITTRQEYYRLEERLRQIDFRNDDESGVICRFKQPESGLVLDVMPSDEARGLQDAGRTRLLRKSRFRRLRHVDRRTRGAD